MLFSTVNISFCVSLSSCLRLMTSMGSLVPERFPSPSPRLEFLLTPVRLSPTPGVCEPPPDQAAWTLCCFVFKFSFPAPGFSKLNGIYILSSNAITWTPLLHSRPSGLIVICFSWSFSTACTRFTYDSGLHCYSLT